MKSQLSDANAEMLENIKSRTQLNEPEIVNLILDQFRKTPEQRVQTILLHRHVKGTPELKLNFDDVSYTEEQAKEMFYQIGDDDGGYQ